jgi:predicted Fe-Mo cluster-binding NifX family protein
MKIAVAVSDDEKFTEHFGKAQKFRIYEFNEYEMMFTEKRISLKNYGEKHQWGKSLNVIGDCDVIICLQIGLRAKPALKQMGKKIVEDDGRLEDVLQRFINHQKFIDKPIF